MEEKTEGKFSIYSSTKAVKVVRRQFIRFEKKHDWENFSVLRFDFTKSSWQYTMAYLVGTILQPVWIVLSRLTKRVVDIGYEERK